MAYEIDSDSSLSDKDDETAKEEVPSSPKRVVRNVGLRPGALGGASARQKPLRLDPLPEMPRYQGRGGGVDVGGYVVGTEEEEGIGGNGSAGGYGGGGYGGWSRRGGMVGFGRGRGVRGAVIGGGMGRGMRGGRGEGWRGGGYGGHVGVGSRGRGIGGGFGRGDWGAGPGQGESGGYGEVKVEVKSPIRGAESILPEGELSLLRKRARGKEGSEVVRKRPGVRKRARSMASKSGSLDGRSRSINGIANESAENLEGKKENVKNKKKSVGFSLDALVQGVKEAGPGLIKNMGRRGNSLERRKRAADIYENVGRSEREVKRLEERERQEWEELREEELLNREELMKTQKRATVSESIREGKRILRAEQSIFGKDRKIGDLSYLSVKIKEMKRSESFDKLWNTDVDDALLLRM